MGVSPRTGAFGRAICLGAALTLLSGLAACQRSATGAGATGRVAAAGVASPAPNRPAVGVRVTPVNASLNVAPKTPVVVSASNGRLTVVRVTTAQGTVVPGILSSDAARWTSTGVLDFSTSYSVAAHAVDRGDRATLVTSTFTTATPAGLTFPSVVPGNGETVGVGIPIIINWSRRVPDRAAAERLLTVTSDKPVGGSWHWLSGSEVHYRPRVYWPAYSHVTVNVDVGSADLGDGVYGEKSRKISFTVGSSVVANVSNATKSMTVYQDGRPLRTIPVSLGRAAMPTSSGTMVVFARYAEKFFDSASFGLPRDAPGGYYTKVYWDTKYTYGGEYIHAAPWSVGDQGRRNVSHGCINVSTSNARWFYHLTKRGDIVQVTGTERSVAPGDGWTDWNVSWDRWLAGSALH